MFGNSAHRIPRRPAIYIFFTTLILIVSLQADLQGQDQQTTDQPSPALGARKEAPKGGTIRGKVIGADTGDGLKESHPGSAEHPSARGDQPTSTQTDANGEYQFEDVKPGKYSLSARRNGYVDTDLWAEVDEPIFTNGWHYPGCPRRRVAQFHQS